MTKTVSKGTVSVKCKLIYIVNVPGATKGLPTETVPQDTVIVDGCSMIPGGAKHANHRDLLSYPH